MSAVVRHRRRVRQRCASRIERWRVSSSSRLDKELQQIAPDSETGRRYVDKLFEVRLKSGVEQWILIHIEVQMDNESDFPVRMFIYHYRIFDKYNRREVVSFAVLGDDNPAWRPQSYSYQRWGTEVGFRFPVVKLLDYAARRQELEASDNPFATVVLAHLDTQETRQRLGERKDRKFALVRRLRVTAEHRSTMPGRRQSIAQCVAARSFRR